MATLMARNFAAVIKEANPITTPSVYEYGANGARRARTYSQVIADATRGVDAGMNRFTPQRPDLSSDAYAPDWRGHYLGKRAEVPGSLYVSRPLANADDLEAWAKGAGIANVVPAAEMHVTQVYSRTPVKLNTRGDMITAAGGARSIGPLGDKGAVVLHFASPELDARHQEAIAAGASHDFPKFQTHVTLSYDAGGADVSEITPPSFPLEFGPEVHAPINEDWATDTGLRKREIVVPITKFDEAECLVFGWAQVIEEGGSIVCDHQGDEVSEDDLEKAFYHFAHLGRETDEMHTDTCKGHMVECMVFTKAKQKLLGIDLGKVGAWVGFKVDRDSFAKVQDGTYPAFSIGGIGRRVQIPEV